MYGIAILGTGDIANTHIEAYQALAGRCEIRALVDMNREKAEEKRSKYGLSCQVLTDYHDILNRDDIQLVSVCLPPSLHCETASALLRAGKHVLCEKPMAVSLEECDRMLQAAREGGALLSVVAQNRFKTDVMRTKKLLDSGALGKLLYAQANSLWWRGDNYYALWWRGSWEKEGGGCTFIHAVHHIDLFLWLMGAAESVQSMVMNQNHNGSEVEDLSMSMVRFKNGAAGTLTSSLLHHGEKQNFLIDGTEGSIEIPHGLAVSRQLENGYPKSDDSAARALEQAFESIPELAFTGHLGQIDDVLSALETGREPLITGEDGRRTVEFIAGVYQSAFLGETVHFPMTEKDPFYSREGVLNHAVRFHEKGASVEGFADVGISVGGTL